MSLSRLIERGLGITDLSPSQVVIVADKIQTMMRNFIDLANQGCPVLAEEMYEKEEKELLESVQPANTVPYLATRVQTAGVFRCCVQTAGSDWAQHENVPKDAASKCAHCERKFTLIGLIWTPDDY